MSFSVSVVTTVVLALTFAPNRRSPLLACSWFLRCVARESLRCSRPTDFDILGVHHAQGAGCLSLLLITRKII